MSATATTFKNLKSLTIAGVAILEPLTLTLEHDGDIQVSKVDGDIYPSIVATGARVRSGSFTNGDPVSALAARGAMGASSFSVLKGGDSSGAASFDIGVASAANFSSGTGSPGELGTSGGDFQLDGSTFTET